MINANDPRYRPLWIRITITLGALGWGVFEFATQSPGFALIFIALGIFAAWRLLWTYDPDAATDPENPDDITKD